MRVGLNELLAAKQASRWVEVEKDHGDKSPEQVSAEIEQVPVGDLVRDKGNANRVLHSFPVGTRFGREGFETACGGKGTWEAHVTEVDVSDFGLGWTQWYIQKTADGEFEVVQGAGCGGDGEPIIGAPLPVIGQPDRYQNPGVFGTAATMAQYLPKK